jgi:DNA-binding NtrC family response regulator
MKTGKYRILFVDDEKEFLRSLERGFRSDEKIDVDLASSPLEAMRLLDTFSYDAIIADWKMPVINGVDLLTLVSRRHPEIPRGLITGEATVRHVAAAVNNGGARWVFIKPVELGLMRNKLISMLENP